ncbi:MAG: zinc ribbon domain-containing protein [Planctomycetota bacterium]
MKKHIDEGHQQVRSVLRVVGPMVATTGLVLVVIGLGSFFSSFGSFGPPRYFWCAFVGIPLLGVGFAICRFAFMGRVARYVANEVAPVGKDTFNYMASGTKDAVGDLASAVGEGLRAGNSTEPTRLIRCHKCNRDNDAAANFCNGCGAALQKSKACPSCHELNDPDARFCDNCGQEIG